MSTVEKPKHEPFDNGPIGPDGQYRSYAVLPQSERDKGFIRPVRQSYRHVGDRPKYPLRDLTEEEKVRYAAYQYVSFEAYPENPNSIRGRFWAEKQLKPKCGTTTTMGRALAETYARDNTYYGATFCCHCREHLPVSEFVWEGTDEVVGS
jgi:hypothetical protein